MNTESKKEKELSEREKRFIHLFRQLGRRDQKLFLAYLKGILTTKKED